MKKTFVLLFLLLAQPCLAEFSTLRIYGNHTYDDDTIQKILGVEHGIPLSDIEMKRKLETSGYFSSIRIFHTDSATIIVVREKTPWFVLPYFTSDADSNIYGVAGGLMGINGTEGKLVGRAQTGKNQKAFALLFRDEFFLDSFWIFGASFDHETAKHNVYSGREIIQRTENRATNFTQQLGYHLLPNLKVRLDTHIEDHKFEEEDRSIHEGSQWSHRILAEYGSYYLNEGLARGYMIKPYFEFTNPLSHFKFYQIGFFGQYSAYLKGDFNWITRPRFEFGSPLPRYQKFELGGSNLRGFPSQSFRAQSYSAVQNDFLLTSWDIWKLKVRPIVYMDWAYIQNGGRTSLGTGLQVYFRQVAIPAIQIYGGYGFNPNGFSIIAAIGPQL